MKYSFIKAGAKHLSAVEVEKLCSNQHEFNGVAALRGIFGTRRQEFNAIFIYYDEYGEVLNQSVGLTWYDAREANPRRSSEYRLYYTNNSIVNEAQVNDLLVVGKREDGSIVVMIVKHGCGYYHVFMRLFGLENISDSYVIRNEVNL